VDVARAYSNHVPLADFMTFAAWISQLRELDWWLYAKPPFGGPKPVLAYLSRYTHRIAISNRRLVAWDDAGVTFNYKDYRIEGPDRYKVMTLSVSEFIRRFLMHVLPKRFHRIRHYGAHAEGEGVEGEDGHDHHADQKDEGASGAGAALQYLVELVLAALQQLFEVGMPPRATTSSTTAFTERHGLVLSVDRLSGIASAMNIEATVWFS
jgi:hypothetical protein